MFWVEVPEKDNLVRIPEADQEACFIFLAYLFMKTLFAACWLKSIFH